MLYLLTCFVRRQRWHALYCGLAMGLCSTLAWGTQYTMSSLEWPPYTSAQLPALGASSAIVTQAIQASGHQVQIDFLPWNRAVALAKHDPRYLAYFPEYQSHSNRRTFLYSDPIGVSPLVFIQRKDKPVVWKQLSDVLDKKIGVVLGYVNTEALDAHIANRTVQVNQAPNDLRNLLTLVNGKVDLVVIDLNVYRHLVRHEPSLQRYAEQLQVNPKTLAGC